MTRLDYVIMILLVPEKAYTYTDNYYNVMSECVTQCVT